MGRKEHDDGPPQVQPSKAGGGAVEPDHGRAVHVLADVPERRFGRSGLRRPGQRRSGVPARLRPRFSQLGEQRKPRLPGLRVQLDPRCGDSGGRAGRRHPPYQPAADRLRALRPGLPELRRRPRSGGFPHKRHSPGLDQPDGRPGPADAGHPGRLRPGRRADPSRGHGVDSSQPGLPPTGLPGRDLQPVGGSVRRIVLCPLGATQVLPDGHGQHRGDPGPELAQ